MTSPLSQEQRVELVAKAKAATPGPWFHCQPSMVVPKQRTIHGPVPARRVDYVSTWADMGTPPGHRVVLPMPGEEGPSVRSLDMAFIAAANPDTILAYEATVVALTEERDAALERVKALEAGGVVSLADARRAVDACGGTHPPGQEEYGRGYNAALTEADAALVRLGKEQAALLTPKDPGQ